MKAIIKDVHSLTAYEHGHLANMNIFRPVRRGRAKGVEVSGFCGGAKLNICMFHQLSNGDEDLLLLLYSLARPFHHTEELMDGDLRDAVIPTKGEGDFCKSPSISFRTTKYALCKALGKVTTGLAYSNLGKALLRLSRTSITYETTRFKGVTHLMGFIIDKETGGIDIGINPLSASILLGEKVSYIRYDLDERFTLKEGIPRRLHSILSGSLTKGKGCINLHLLVKKVYGENATADRIRVVKRALNELFGLPKWSIEIRGRGKKSMVYYGREN